MDYIERREHEQRVCDIITFIFTIIMFIVVVCNLI
jgi:hypothetical protein